MRRLVPLLTVASSIAFFAGCPALTKPSADDPITADSRSPEKGASASAKVAVAVDSAKPTKEAAPDRIQASHLLVSWKGAQRSTQDRTKEQARARVLEALAKIRGGTDFAAVASEYGEDATKAKGGDLGSFGHGQMVGPFEDAAFKLRVGEVSEVVETPFGFHLIKRTQ